MIRCQCLEKQYLSGKHILKFIPGKGHMVESGHPKIFLEEEQSLGLTICQNRALFADFHLTEDNRLMPSTKTFLKNRYTVLRDNV